MASTSFAKFNSPFSGLFFNLKIVIALWLNEDDCRRTFFGDYSAGQSGMEARRVINSLTCNERKFRFYVNFTN